MGLEDRVWDESIFSKDPTACSTATWLTYIWTAEVWLYVAAVIDLFSRCVVGWSVKAELVTDALVMVASRQPDALLHRSDRGSQYASEQFQRLLADASASCSMSRSESIWDNSVMEGFFSSLKTESGMLESLPDPQSGKNRCVRLRRTLLQSKASPLDDRLSQSDEIRPDGRICLGSCP